MPGRPSGSSMALDAGRDDPRSSRAALKIAKATRQWRAERLTGAVPAAIQALMKAFAD